MIISLVLVATIGGTRGTASRATASVGTPNGEPPLAWGSNTDGQLARNPSGPIAAPQEVRGLGRVKEVSAGMAHSLALLENGTVMSWGRNAELQLGDGRSTILRNPTRPPGPRATPEPVQRSCGPEACEPLSELKSIAAGGYHNLAVKSDGTVWAWGSHDCGQLGNGKLPTSGFTLTAPSSVPTQVLALNGGVAVAAGRAHSLALDNRGMLWGWGDNSWGQVGNGARPIGESGRCVIAPTKVALPTRVVAFAAGSDHSLALTEDGTVWSWGVNCSGQLGSLLDKESHRYAPAPVIGGWGDQDPVVSLAAGGEYGIGHSLALTQNGQVWAWGLAGVLGSAGGGDVPSPCKDNPAFMPREGFLSPRSPDLEQRARPTPRQVSGLSGAVFIEAGAFHSVVINEEGELFTWGRNDQGQLGQPPGGSTTVPALTRPLAVASAGGGIPPDDEDGNPGPTRSHTLALPGIPPNRLSGPGPILPDLSGITVPTTSPPLPITTPPPTTPENPGFDDPFSRDKNVLPGSGGGVFVSGFNVEEFAKNGSEGARYLIKRAVAYVTPGTDRPRLLLVPRYEWTSKALIGSGFSQDCPPSPDAAGCFDIAYNTEVRHRHSDDRNDEANYRGDARHDLRSVSFTDYDALIVGQYLFWSDMHVLVQRQDELYAYVNDGGGLIALPQCCTRDACDDVEQGCYPSPTEITLSILPFLNHRYMELGPVAPYTVTPEGRAIGLSERDVNGYPGLTYFTAPCYFDVIARFAPDQRIMALATHKPLVSTCTPSPRKDKDPDPNPAGPAAAVANPAVGSDSSKEASQATRPPPPSLVAPVLPPVPVVVPVPAVAPAPALSQATAESQATSQAQSPSQSQAQSPQVGVSLDKERERQVELERADQGEGGPQELLASERSPSPRMPVALVGGAALLALGLGAIRRRTTPVPDKEPVSPVRADDPSHNLWLRRVREQR